MTPIGYSTRIGITSVAAAVAWCSSSAEKKRTVGQRHRLETRTVDVAVRWCARFGVEGTRITVGHAKPHDLDRARAGDVVLVEASPGDCSAAADGAAAG